MLLSTNFTWTILEYFVLDDGSFDLISNLYDPFKIDRFADNLNHRVEKFNVKYHCPRISHVNALLPIG